MRKLSLVLLAVALLAVFITPAQASSFTIGCTYHHTAKDDPIGYPKQPGASHSHDFFGNTTTNAYSTVSSLAGKPTTCKNAGDTAAYWAPSVYLNGTQVKPGSITAYYYRKTTGTLTAFPQGFQMIAGDSHATTTQPTSVIYWGCGHGSGISKVTSPPNCTGYGTLAVHISFPYCWTGTQTTGNDTSQVSYTCDSAHPYHFPQLVIRENFSLVDAHAITLASGSYITEHADYFSVWDVTELNRLIATL